MTHSHLPHIDMKAYYQFITFRTADSTDNFLLSLIAQSKSNRERQMAMDEYLDASQQGAYLNGDVLYNLVCFVVMPNHVHMLIKPLQKLSVLMQRLKGASAKAINDMLGRHGVFWKKDYYDKAIRDEGHFRVVYRYIKNNALKLKSRATEVAPPGFKTGVGSAPQGECCLQQRERPGVLVAQAAEDLGTAKAVRPDEQPANKQGSGGAASAAQQAHPSGMIKAVHPDDLRFYGLYDD